MEFDCRICNDGTKRIYSVRIMALAHVKTTAADQIKCPACNKWPKEYMEVVPECVALPSMLTKLVDEYIECLKDQVRKHNAELVNDNYSGRPAMNFLYAFAKGYALKFIEGIKSGVEYKDLNL